MWFMFGTCGGYSFGQPAYYVNVLIKYREAAEREAAVVIWWSLGTCDHYECANSDMRHDDGI